MNMSNNFDFFVYNCSGFGGCIDRSIRSGFGDESIMINNLFGIYYLIVDVWIVNIMSSFCFFVDCEYEDDFC